MANGIEKLSIRLFKNDFKQSEKHPDFKGGLVNATDLTFEADTAYSVAVWIDEKGMGSVVFTKMREEDAVKYKAKQKAYLEKRANQLPPNESTEIFPPKATDQKVDFENMDASGRPIKQANNDFPTDPLGGGFPSAIDDTANDLPF